MYYSAIFSKKNETRFIVEFFSQRKCIVTGLPPFKTFPLYMCVAKKNKNDHYDDGCDEAQVVAQE